MRWFSFRDNFTVPLGAIPELSAKSYLKILFSEEEMAASGIYWLNVRGLGILQVIAHFSCKGVALTDYYLPELPLLYLSVEAKK